MNPLWKQGEAPSYEFRAGYARARLPMLYGWCARVPMWFGHAFIPIPACRNKCCEGNKALTVSQRCNSIAVRSWLVQNNYRKCNMVTWRSNNVGMHWAATCASPEHWGRTLPPPPFQWAYHLCSDYYNSMQKRARKKSAHNSARTIQPLRRPPAPA